MDEGEEDDIRYPDLDDEDDFDDVEDDEEIEEDL